MVCLKQTRRACQKKLNHMKKRGTTVESFLFFVVIIASLNHDQRNRVAR